MGDASVQTQKPRSQARELRLEKARKENVSATARLEKQHRRVFQLQAPPHRKSRQTEKNEFSYMNNIKSAESQEGSQARRQADLESQGTLSTWGTLGTLSPEEVEKLIFRNKADSSMGHLKRSALRKDLARFHQQLQQGQRRRFQKKVRTKVRELANQLRERHRGELAAMNDRGALHPQANAQRAHAAFLADLQTKLDVVALEDAVLEEMLEEERARERTLRDPGQRQKVFGVFNAMGGQFAAMAATAAAGAGEDTVSPLPGDGPAPAAGGGGRGGAGGRSRHGTSGGGGSRARSRITTAALPSSRPGSPPQPQQRQQPPQGPPPRRGLGGWERPASPSTGGGGGGGGGGGAAAAGARRRPVDPLIDPNRFSPELGRLNETVFGGTKDFSDWDAFHRDIMDFENFKKAQASRAQTAAARLSSAAGGSSAASGPAGSLSSPGGGGGGFGGARPGSPPTRSTGDRRALTPGASAALARLTHEQPEFADFMNLRGTAGKRSLRGAASTRELGGLRTGVARHLDALPAGRRQKLPGAGLHRAVMGPPSFSCEDLGLVGDEEDGGGGDGEQGEGGFRRTRTFRGNRQLAPGFRNTFLQEMLEEEERHARDDEDSFFASGRQLEEEQSDGGGGGGGGGGAAAAEGGSAPANVAPGGGPGPGPGPGESGLTGRRRTPHRGGGGAAPAPAAAGGAGAGAGRQPSPGTPGAQLSGRRGTLGGEAKEVAQMRSDGMARELWAIFDRLRMPAGRRLHFLQALCTPERAMQFKAILAAWRAAADRIHLREKLKEFVVRLDQGEVLFPERAMTREDMAVLEAAGCWADYPDDEEEEEDEDEEDDDGTLSRRTPGGGRRAGGGGGGDRPREGSLGSHLSLLSSVGHGSLAERLSVRESLSLCPEDEARIFSHEIEHLAEQGKKYDGSKTKTWIERLLANLTESLQKLLTEAQLNYGEIITYNGLPYIRELQSSSS